MTIYLGKAIFSLRPGCEFTLKNHDYSTIEWIVLEGEAPSAKEVEAEMKRLEQAELTAETDKAIAKTALLDRLGITADEAALLLG